MVRACVLKVRDDISNGLLSEDVDIHVHMQSEAVKQYCQLLQLFVQCENKN